MPAAYRKLLSSTPPNKRFGVFMAKKENLRENILKPVSEELVSPKNLEAVMKWSVIFDMGQEALEPNICVDPPVPLDYVAIRQKSESPLIVKKYIDG